MFIIPHNWSRSRKLIAKAYFRHLENPQDKKNIVKMIGYELEYTPDKNRNFPFVRYVIREVRKLDGAH